MAPLPDARLESRFEGLYRCWWPSIEALIHETISSACPEDSLLREMALYHTRTGGKRLRAILPLLVAEAMDADPARLLPFGAACETLHGASLVHDDLQDHDTMRRGHLTVWRRFGAGQAINLGDALIACALLLAQRLDLPPELRERVSRRMLLEMLRTTEGQVRDLENRAGLCDSVDRYMRTVEGKTARLFALPLSGAATLCGADEAVEQALSEAASHIGVLFQVQDDIMDTLGGGRDIVEGKRNLPIVHCLSTAQTRDAERLLQILDTASESTTAADVAGAQALIERTGSFEYAVAELLRRREAAVSIPVLLRYPPLVRMLQDASKVFLRPVEALLAQREWNSRKAANY